MLRISAPVDIAIYGQFKGPADASEHAMLPLMLADCEPLLP
jgi:hypothetical protein